VSGEEDLSGCGMENVMDWIGEETTVQRKAQLGFSSSGPRERGRVMGWGSGHGNEIFRSNNL